jgi:hypothetical protein
MAVMAWRRERFEFFSADALIMFLLLAEDHQPDRSDRIKSMHSFEVALRSFNG